MSIMRQIGYSGLHAAQIALATTSQNIANVHTPGYSRVVPQLHSVAGYGKYSIGGGVQVSSIHRLSNDFQNQQLWRTSSDLNYHQSAQQYLDALESLVGSDGSSISVGLDNFFAALSEASGTPESIVLRQQIINEAKQLGQRFNGLSGNIDTQIGALHGQRTAMVAEINGLTANIAELNKRIVQLESAGHDTATLRDHRDSLVQGLSQYADIRVQHMEDSSLSVSLANGQPLVVRTTAGRMQVDLVDGEQNIALVFTDTSFPLNQQGLGGSLGGLYDSEYVAMRPVQAELHDMAKALAELVNDTLAGGYDLNGDQGEPLFIYDELSITGMLTLNELSPEQLAFSSVAGGAGNEDLEVGNNDVLLQLLELKNQNIEVAGSQVSLNDAYAGLLGRVASTSRQNKADLSSADTVAREAQAQRDSVSAVNQDEEAINLMSYVQAYQANLKVISTSDQLFTALLGMF